MKEDERATKKKIDYVDKENGKANSLTEPFPR